MGILDKIKRAADPRSRIVSADMKRLDEVERGLGDKAVHYIMSGEGEMVLSTLSTKCSGSELEVGAYYFAHKSPSRARRKLLAQDSPYNVELAKRYTEVMAATRKDLDDNSAGTDHVPKLVRVFFSEVLPGVKENDNVWPAKPVKISPKGLTLSTAATMTELLGGTHTDLVDVLYQEKGQYGSITGDLYRKVVEIKPLAQSHPQAFVEAGRRVHAGSRAKLIQELHRFGLADTPAFRDFILELAGDSSKAVRETAGSVLSAFDASILEPKAIELLGKGKVASRAGMVELLANIGSDTALNALREHKEKEKTARIISAIDTALTVSSHTGPDPAGVDNDEQYQAIDGSVIDIPPVTPMPEGAPVTFGDSDRETLIQAIRDENDRIKARNAENKKKGYKYQAPLIKEGLARQALSLFNASEPPKQDSRQRLNSFLSWGPGKEWARSAMARLPQDKALRMASALSFSIRGALSPYGQGAFIEAIRDYIHSPDGDLRQLERIDGEVGTEFYVGHGNDRAQRTVKRGDLLRYIIQDSYSYMEPQLDNVPHDALWPYLAQNLNVVDEAFGLKPQTWIKLSRVGAIKTLSRLPKPPARFFAQLLSAATGETKNGRAEARTMLANAPDVEQHVEALLNDSRQAVRAGAAEWIAERNQTGAVPKLKARLKKEKSELAKAAILTTLESLGEDLSGFVGPKALLEEAQAGLKKAKLDKLAWMGLDHLPSVRYRSGRAVPDEVLKWWLFVAVKLKQPGGNALFDIYMSRLDPKDAETFSGWVLDSWYNYDTARPSEEDGNEHAQQNAERNFKSLIRWYKEYTLEQSFADLKREFMSNYLNSGAATKGLLALCQHVSPAIAADRVRTYLKNHGSRTSQASSLLELLAAIGDPVTLQVIISAATRLKQKGVQKFAGSLVEKVAEAKGWSMDELGDRTVPSAGLDEDSVLHLPCGPDRKAYTATIGDSLTFELRNPDGKVIKSLPAGTDDVTKDSKKQLSSSRRELKQVVAMQSARLYEALCSERQWPLEDWQRDIKEHPVMSRLAERVVWIGLDADGQLAGQFRPTAEGDYTDAHDDDVELDDFASIRLAHAALLGKSEAAAWETHLKDYEIKPLFVQFGRELLSLSEEQASATSIEDRKGWVTDTFTFRGAATKLGYERGEAMDGGYFNEYTKSFQSAGLLAVIEFSGNCLPEENEPAAMISLSFERYSGGRRTGGTIKLSDVPPVLLSESWNDYRTIVAKAAFDEQWEQKMPWM